MLSDRVKISLIASGSVPIPDPFTFTNVTYTESQRTSPSKHTVKTSNTLTFPRDCLVKLDWPDDSDVAKEMVYNINGVESTVRLKTASDPIQFYSGDTLKIVLLNFWLVGTKTFNFKLKENSLEGPIIYEAVEIVLSTAGGGECYLTSAMVDHYGLDDNGVELTALRTLRELYGEKHKEMMKRYEKDSVLIIEGIEHSKNPEAYYHFIRQEVNQIVGYTEKEKWTLAEQVYLDLYHDLKELFLDNRGWGVVPK